MRNDSNYLLYEDMVVLIRKLAEEFPKEITLEPIGYTFEQREIPMLTFTLNPNVSSSMLITGAHHARELSSIQLPLYSLMNLLHSYLHGNSTVTALLTRHKLLVVPVVNVDGYKLISDYFMNDADRNSYLYKRKNNNNRYLNGNQCPLPHKYYLFLSDYNTEIYQNVSLGVDLNRNYNWDFNTTMEGSSTDPCDDTYRGPFPFSESETQSIRNLIESKQNELKLVYNIHAFGNLLIHPFNAKRQNTLSTQYPEAYQIYNEIWSEGDFPYGNQLGNAYDTLNYGANGEASDWIFGTYGIIAASPELGLDNADTDNFYIENRTLVVDLLTQNYPWISYSLKKLDVQFGLQVSGTQVELGAQMLSVDLQLINKGFENYAGVEEQQTLRITTNSNALQNVTITSSSNITVISVSGNTIVVQVPTPRNNRDKIPIKLQGVMSLTKLRPSEEMFTITYQEYPNLPETNNRTQVYTVNDLLMNDQNQGQYTFSWFTLVKDALYESIWVIVLLAVFVIAATLSLKHIIQTNKAKKVHMLNNQTFQREAQQRLLL